MLHLNLLWIKNNRVFWAAKTLEEDLRMESTCVLVFIQLPSFVLTDSTTYINKNKTVDGSLVMLSSSSLFDF